MNINIYIFLFLIVFLLIVKEFSCFEKRFHFSCNKDIDVLFIEIKNNRNASTCYKNTTKLKNYFRGKPVKKNNEWLCKNGIFKFDENIPIIDGNKIKFSVFVLKWIKEFQLIKIHCLKDFGKNNVYLNGTSYIQYNNSGK